MSMRRDCLGSMDSMVMRLHGPIGAWRLMRLPAAIPKWASSQPASAPCRCTRSTISCCAGRSSSLHSRTAGNGLMSLQASTIMFSVHTTAQPPSALVSRIAAVARGDRSPTPLQWGTW